MNSQENQWFALQLVGNAPHAYPPHDSDHDDAARQLNSLLRGEIAASETYRMAIDKLIQDGRDPNQVATLRIMQREHVQVAQIFRKRIAEMGGVSDNSSGGWGAWAKLAMGAAQLFGDSAALHALRDGEEYGLNEMRSAIENLDAGSAELVEKAMIPAQRRHIQRITSLINATAA
jgi:hypothetical protein